MSTEDDKDAEGAMKRLKLKPPASRSSKGSSKGGSGSKKKGAAPILAIIYPATAIDPSGRAKVSPKVLAQHHCHPPPSSPEVLGAWVGSLRKRHLREFAKLQHDRREFQLLKERSAGYSESMKEDEVREEKEVEELREKKEQEEKERARLLQIEERRKELLEGLAEEPEGGEGVITIALRFAEGNKRDQRRFISSDTYLNDVFDWIDAVHSIERETVELSTMNGSKVFRYVEEEMSDNEENEGGEVDVTLEEAGLGRMTALRVSVIVEESEEEDGEERGEYDEESDEE